jgi:uroporphyrinogen-III synthase
MTGAPGLPRLALARPAQHPLAEAVRRAGWEPVPYPFTHAEPTDFPPPRSWPKVAAVLVLSPAGARAVAAVLPEGMRCLVQGAGTAEGLGRPDLAVLLPAEARAEALWDLLQATFPDGGDFLLVRGERSRGFLESAAQGTAWNLHPWTTHREAAVEPLPSLPAVEAVLALSPLQAEVLAPAVGAALRFAWGQGTAEAFAWAGAPAHATCDPKPEQLEALLVANLPKKEESPC